MVELDPDHPPGITTGFGSGYSQSVIRQKASPYGGGMTPPVDSPLCQDGSPGAVAPRRTPPKPTMEKNSSMVYIGGGKFC